MSRATTDAPPFYIAETEQAVEEAMAQAARLGQRGFVEHLWAAGYEIRKRGGRR